jgi:hypothetical protein
MNFGYNYTEYINFVGYLPYYHGTLLVITIPLFILYLYIALTKTPKELGIMKYFILNVAITNFLLVIIYFLFQPAALFPLVGGFSFGILRIFGTEGSYLSLEITFVIILNQVVSYTCLMMYQYAIMKGRGKLVEFIKNPKLFIGSYIAYVFIAVAITITFMRLARSEKETIFMDFGQNEPDLLGFIQTVFINQVGVVRI